MLFAEGIPGQLSKGVASTVAFSLLASLFVALTIVPMLASVFFRARTEIAVGVKGSGAYAKMQSRFQEGRIMGWVKDRYESVLRFSLRRWVRPVVFVAVMFVALLSGGLMFLVGAEFMPVSDQQFLPMKVSLPVGTSLETTDRVVRQIEQTLSRTPEVQLIGAWGVVSEATQQDVAYGSADAGVNFAQVFVKLSEKTERTRSSMEITDGLRKEMPDVEGGKFDFPDMNAQMFGSMDKPITVNVYGRDLATLKKLSERVADSIVGIEGLRDVDTSLRKGQPEIGVRIDRERAGNMGLTAGQVASEIQTAMLGTIATALRQGGEELDVRLRYAPRFRSSRESLAHIPIKTPFGTYVLVTDLAVLEAGSGAVRIDREGQMRKAVIGANYVDRDLNSIVKDIKAKLHDIEKKEFPAGYSTEITGQYEKMQDFNDYLVLAFLLAILLVYMVMAAQFESFGQPFIVMFTMPLALIGVAVLLFLTGNRFNVVSGMGVVILAGIVVNNGIILIDFVNQLRQRGLDTVEALVEAGRTRLRPILITSLTTIIGMLPMVWDRGDGSEMRSPMAITVIGGLGTSTFLTLVFIPVVYSLFDSVGRRLGFRRLRITFAPEPAQGPVPAAAPAQPAPAQHAPAQSAPAQHVQAQPAQSGAAAPLVIEAQLGQEANG